MMAVRQDLSSRCPRLCRTSSNLAEGARFALAMGYQHGGSPQGPFRASSSSTDSLRPVKRRAPDWSLPPTHTQRFQKAERKRKGLGRSIYFALTGSKWCGSAALDTAVFVKHSITHGQNNQQ